MGSRSSSEFVGVHPNYTVRSGISEAELVDLYRAATLLVMPLHDTTANNAVLEGLACGLPLVASDVGAIRDYVNSKCAALVRPHDARCMAEAILDLLDAPAERQKMAEQARTQALKFAWPTVMQELGRVYAKIA